MNKQALQKPHYSLPLLIVLHLLTLLVASCTQAQEMVGEHPHVALPTVVEAYLEKYQPGPLPRLFQTTYLYDRNGTQLAEIFGEGRRVWMPLDQISPFLIDATIATEDATFRTNGGIDPFRVAMALWQNNNEGRVVSGASTITMQLARNLFVGQEERYNNSMDRKLLEAGLSQELTIRYSKDELLEMYLNLLNYGNLAYGPEAAAQVYFGKHASELTLAEATLLAGIPQRPAALNPFRDWVAVKQRQSVVLDLMVKHNTLSRADADQAYRKPVALKSDISPTTMLAPHFVQYTIQTLDAHLGDGYTRRSGLNIYTTLDLRMQNIAQKIASETIAKVKKQYNMSNASLVALRPGTSEVLAMVGSVDFNDVSIAGQVNVAIMPRQPGSTIKPVMYTTAFNDLVISPASIFFDTPVSYNLGANQYYQPRNYDNQFHGMVTARTALANSFNIPAVRLYDGMGFDRFVKGARAMGLESLSEKDRWRGLTLALGSKETPLIEMVTAYNTIASGGLYSEPKVVVKFLDHQGQPVNPLKEVAPVQVVSSGSAFLTTDIMSDNTARTFSFGANSVLKLSRPAAVKTGTTNDFRDNWTIGFTKYLVTGVWAGNSNGQPMVNSTGISGAAPIWHDFMEAVIADPDLLHLLGAPKDDAKAWEFTPPADVEQRPECPARLECRSGGEYFSRDWLNAAGAAGPLADSFVREETVAVYTNRYSDDPGWPIYCAKPGGKERTLLRMSNVMGLATADTPIAGGNQDVQAPATATTASEAPDQNQETKLAERALSTDVGKLPIARAANNQVVVMFYADMELERLRKVRWSLARGLAVNLGPCDALQYYSVQAGDYWGKLAQRFGLTLADLQGVNPQFIRGEGVLHPGDKLLVPAGTAIEIGDGSGEYYTVQAGDSWMKVAESFEIPLRLLQSVNPEVVRPYFILRAGDKIFVPHLNQPELLSQIH
ncbi:MAG: transglycosylase domain-containing protein [Chloroflexi bacterium]|nr:transglycosylase domain-containing protein [Chloroflexota bacterium]